MRLKEESRPRQLLRIESRKTAKFTPGDLLRGRKISKCFRPRTLYQFDAPAFLPLPLNFILDFLAAQFLILSSRPRKIVFQASAFFTGVGSVMATSEIQASSAARAEIKVAPGAGSRVRAIVLNTFRESVRDRVLYNLILFVLLLVGASVFISELTVDRGNNLIANLGLSAMLLFGALIAIFIGVGLVYKEIDRRTIYNLLSKPVHRHEFIIGKYFGLCLTLLVNTSVMVLGLELALLYVNRGFVAVHLTILPAAFLIFLELALLVAVALMFSTFSTPMLSALFSFAIYIAGHLSADLKLAAQVTDSVLIRAVLYVAYYLLPNLSNFGFIDQASRGNMASGRMIIAAAVYAIIYVSILLSASALIFQKRNFK